MYIYILALLNRWRRPEEAAKVKLFDITRGLPQRIEGQFRRHWSLTPALWNLYFRERVNLGASLSIRNSSSVEASQEDVEQDAAMAAASLLKKLQHGFYLDKGKRRKSKVISPNFILQRV